MSGPYSLRVTDRAGTSFYAEAPTFDRLLTLARSYACRLPRDILCAFNDDRADCDTNGLTDEETERFDEVVAEARRPLGDNERDQLRIDCAEMDEERSGVSDDDVREEAYR